MIAKLSRKDIKMLESSVKNDVSKSALEEYLSAHKKAETAWKVFRDSLVLSEGSSEDNASKEMKHEKVRKFKAGDKVRVLSGKSNIATTKLRVGDITEVICYKGDDSKYAALDPNFRTVVVLDPLDASGQGFFEEYALELVVEEQEKSANELRAEIIQRAKEFVEEKEGYGLIWLKLDGKSRCVVDINFVVNDKKRTVVALLKDFLTREVNSKGIAKCNPDDVFNEHIGKAIALGRALGKDVSEFENAIQPTEPVIGHVVEGIESAGFYRRDRKFTLTSKQGDSFYYAEAKEYEPDEPDDFIFNDQIGKIVDDTNAQYSSSTDQGH